jgi:hypothetical protein
LYLPVGAPGGPTRNVGIKDEKTGKYNGANTGFASANYGWYSRTAKNPTTIPGVNVAQAVGLAHDLTHVDYSQVVRLVLRPVEICRPAAIAGLGDIDYKLKPKNFNCTLPNGQYGQLYGIDIYDMPYDPSLKRLLTNDPQPLIMRNLKVEWTGRGACPVSLVGGGSDDVCEAYETSPGVFIPPFSPDLPGGTPPPGRNGTDLLWKLGALAGGAAVGWYGLSWLRRAVAGK